MNNSCVSVLGCGWLGLPLAESLLRHGYRVKGSTTTLEKISVLKKAGIFPFLVSLERDTKSSQQAAAFAQSPYVIKSNGNIADFLDTCVLVITLPFRRDFTDPYDYKKQITAILSHCLKVKHIIFTSSTSVYPDDIQAAVEDARFTPDTERAKVLYQVEEEILKRKGTVIRFSGLYGGSRKIGNFLVGRRELSGANSPVNLIHQDDAVGILQMIVEKREQSAGEIFNGCSDGHPTKRELYTRAAKKMNMAALEFVNEKERVKKIVVNEKVKKVLGYQFLHPDPLKDI